MSQLSVEQTNKKKVVEACDRILKELNDIAKPVIEQGYANDGNLLSTLVNKAQELKARWRKE